MAENEAPKVALVTGGARRIGAAIVRCLHASGLRLAVHYRASESDAKALVDELNANRADSAHAFPLDLRETSLLSGLVESCVAHFGRLDVLVNNASTFYPTPVAETTQADWQDLLGVNLKAPLFLSQAAAAHLAATRGCIVNIADIYADRPLKGHAVYSAAKAGLVTLTRALAVELGPAVRVNAVAPGAILWPEHADDDGLRDAVIGRTALKRMGDPEDVARAVRFLVNDAAYTTGEVIAVDGGRNLQY
jgi:pteridine reductase